jgi:hypothetical protein
MQWVSGALFPRVKRLGSEADHSPASSGEVRNTRIYKEVLNSLDRLAACALIGDWFVNS